MCVCFNIWVFAQVTSLHVVWNERRFERQDTCASSFVHVHICPCAPMDVWKWVLNLVIRCKRPLRAGPQRASQSFLAPPRHKQTISLVERRWETNARAHTLSRNTQPLRKSPFTGVSCVFILCGCILKMVLQVLQRRATAAQGVKVHPVSSFRICFWSPHFTLAGEGSWSSSMRRGVSEASPCSLQRGEVGAGEQSAHSSWFKASTLAFQCGKSLRDPRKMLCLSSPVPPPTNVCCTHAS